MEDNGDDRTQTFHIRMGKEKPPTSGRRSGRRSERPVLPASTPLFNKAKSDMISYEDLLVAQYMEDLKRQKATSPRRERNAPVSPYLQRLPHNNLRYGKNRRRPASAAPVSRPMSGKPKIDAKFIADTNLWDPESPRIRRGSRPVSAPVRRARPQSAFSVRSRPRSGRRAIYRRQPHIIKVFAFKNGSRDIFMFLAAPTMKILLELATEKLGLPFAARRVFLEDGIEIFSELDIPINGDIYISMGENYKDPFRSTKRSMIARNKSVWTMTGIVLPDGGREKSSKTRLSKRMRSLCENKKVRILVFKNGNGMEPQEVVADLANMEDFLKACTGKLDLRSHAKIVYDWQMSEVTDLKETPVLHECIGQQGKTPVLGPLWISTGEFCSPTGPYLFLKKMLMPRVDGRLKRDKKFKEELESALAKDKDNVTILELLSMSDDELEASLKKVDEDIYMGEEDLKEITEKLESLSTAARQEEAEGSRFRMSHIKEVSANHPLVGTHGLKLKVYENGKGIEEFLFFFNLREALKGVGNNKERVMQRLLDDLSNTRFASGSTNRNLSAVIQKLYNEFGHEIKDPTRLEQEQAVWMSFGEPFVCPFTYCLQLNVDKAIKLVAPEAENEDMEVIVKEGSAPELDEIIKDSSKWEASIGFPALWDSASLNVEEYDPDRIQYLVGNCKIDSRSHYLLLKEQYSAALYPELSFGEKISSKEQTFVISESGYIYSKAFPQLCLGVSDKRVEAKMFDRNVSLEGFVVTMQKKMEGNPNQIWRFSVNTTIISEAYPHLLLTYLGNRHGDEEAYEANTPQGGKIGERFCLVIADELPRKEASAQRFGIKQERFDKIGQWKYTDYTNTEFNKMAYSWPVKRDGTLNERYTWPMEGFIMPHSPPVHKPAKHSDQAPARLRVLRNGERDEQQAIYIVGPNVTNMLKEPTKKDNIKNKKNKGKQSMYNDNTADDLDLASYNQDVRAMELQMFLDHCTSILGLPFAARRLFTAKGVEIFTLADVERDQVVYVTCGETWLDPKLTHKEQKRRYELSRLTSDVNKIYQFCVLRDPQGFVLEVSGPLASGSKVVVNQKWSKDHDDTNDRGDTSLTLPLANPSEDNADKMSEMANSTDPLTSKSTAHEIAHQRAEERLNSLKWPWERLVNVNNSMDNDDPEAKKYTDRDMYEKYKPPTTSTMPRETLQKYTYEDGYLALVSNRTLVLSMAEAEGRVVDVVLAKRRPDDIMQQWHIRENGEIRPRSNAHLVLTVGTPATFSDDPSTFTLAGCPVNLQLRQTTMFGKAHQKWYYDAESGFIHAFATDLPDKEITAANKADVCTYAIAQAADIEQPGYSVEIPSKEGVVEHRLCMSCARSMRGRYKVQKLPPNSHFHCAMGDAKRLKIRQAGSFAVLNNKVDLSTYEAEITLRYWQDVLEVLRRQTSVQTISKEINAAKTVRTVKIMAYKNGEGRLRKGEIVCGSSIEGLLSQCNHRLGMSNAPRRIYLEDGSLVLDIDELVDHAIENCKIEMVNMLALNKDKAGHLIDTDNQLLEEQDDEDEAAKLKRLQSAANVEIASQLKRTAALVSLNADEGQRGTSQRGRGMEEGEDEDEEEEDSQQMEENSDQRDVDNAEAMKIRRERDELLKNIRLPPLDVILRAPIEVWVSSGKAFVSPEVVESKDDNRRKKRQFRSQVCLALDIEKHVLRQMKGRRLDKMQPGTYKSTLSSKQPVIVEKSWTEPTVEERDKHHSVHKLQTHLGEIRLNQQDNSNGCMGVNLDGKLYEQPNMKRIMVYPNGECMEKSVYIWGESIDELLENATGKLGLWKHAKMLYNLSGKKVEDFDEVQRDQLLCVSTGKSFLQPSSERVHVEVKANWGRARKKYGNKATDVVVDVQKNPQVNVDPFGPPLLALPAEQQKAVTPPS